MIRHFLAFTVFSFFLVVSYSASALTVDEIIKLKEAGVSDETIQLLLRIEQEKTTGPKESPSNPYKNMGTWDIKDADGKESTIYTTGIKDKKGDDPQNQEEKEKRKNVWEMLKNLLIDRRNDSQ